MDPREDQDQEDDDEEFLPPSNFSLVEAGVYRSAFPLKKNFPFLKGLGLKAILTLILEEYVRTQVLVIAVGCC